MTDGGGGGQFHLGIAVWFLPIRTAFGLLNGKFVMFGAMGGVCSNPCSE
jgi:hypothetical protein